MANCVHSNVEPTISAIASIMCVRVSMWGFKCLDCGKKWDLGNAMEAFRIVDRLMARIDDLEARLEPYLLKEINERERKAE